MDEELTEYRKKKLEIENEFRNSMPGKKFLYLLSLLLHRNESENNKKKLVLNLACCHYLSCLIPQEEGTNSSELIQENQNDENAKELNDIFHWLQHEVEQVEICPTPEWGIAIPSFCDFSIFSDKLCKITLDGISLDLIEWYDHSENSNRIVKTLKCTHLEQVKELSALFATFQNVLNNVTKLSITYSDIQQYAREDKDSHKENAFNRMPYLQQVDLSNNRLKHIPPAVWQKSRKSLQIVNLANNQISSMEDVFSPSPHGYTALTSINLSHNNLVSTIGLESITSLKSLDLSFNCIEMPSEIAYLVSLSNLEQLYLSGNPVEKMPHYRVDVLSHFSPELVLDDSPWSENELCSQRRNRSNSMDDDIKSLNEQHDLLKTTPVENWFSLKSIFLSSCVLLMKCAILVLLFLLPSFLFYDVVFNSGNNSSWFITACTFLVVLGVYFNFSYDNSSVKDSLNISYPTSFSLDDFLDFLNKVLDKELDLADLPLLCTEMCKIMRLIGFQDDLTPHFLKTEIEEYQESETSSCPSSIQDYMKLNPTFQKTLWCIISCMEFVHLVSRNLSINRHSTLADCVVDVVIKLEKKSKCHELISHLAILTTPGQDSCSHSFPTRELFFQEILKNSSQPITTTEYESIEVIEQKFYQTCDKMILIMSRLKDFSENNSE